MQQIAEEELNRKLSVEVTIIATILIFMTGIMKILFAYVTSSKTMFVDLNACEVSVN